MTRPRDTGAVIYSTGAINAYPQTPPTRRRSMVHVIDVECPDCHAAVGSGCVGLDGTPIKTKHISRRRMATRKANETHERAACDFTESLTAYRRREIREGSGLTQQQLSDFLGLATVQTFADLETGFRQGHDAVATLYGAWLRVWHERIPVTTSKRRVIKNRSHEEVHEG